MRLRGRYLFRIVLIFLITQMLILSTFVYFKPELMSLNQLNVHEKCERERSGIGDRDGEAIDTSKTRDGNTYSHSYTEKEKETYLLGKLRKVQAEVKRLIAAQRAMAGGQSLTKEKPYPPQEAQNYKCKPDANLKIATYNLWNINPPWALRREKIVDVLADENIGSPDVIAFQEIRYNVETGENQLKKIASDLSCRKSVLEKQKQMSSKVQGWCSGRDQAKRVKLIDSSNTNRMHFECCTCGSTCGYVKAKVQDEEEKAGREEGIGLLSFYPIIEAQYYDIEPRFHMEMTNQNNQDKGKRNPTSSAAWGADSGHYRFGQNQFGPPRSRGLLRVLVDTPYSRINFFVTHFSILDMEQCHSVAQMLDIANRVYTHTSESQSAHSGSGSGEYEYGYGYPQIMLGDFNTYFDFEWPLDYLTSPVRVEVPPITRTPLKSQPKSNHNSDSDSNSDSDLRRERQEREQKLLREDLAGSSEFVYDDLNPCKDIFAQKRYIESRKVKDLDSSNSYFRDVWNTIYPWHEHIRLKDLERWPNSALGYTFPTFHDDPRTLDHTRADRILVRDGLSATATVENETRKHKHKPQSKSKSKSKGSMSRSRVKVTECSVAYGGDEPFEWTNDDDANSPSNPPSSSSSTVTSTVMYPSDHMAVFASFFVSVEVEEDQGMERTWQKDLYPPGHPLSNQPTTISTENAVRDIPNHWAKPDSNSLQIANTVIFSSWEAYQSFGLDFVFDKSFDTYFWSNRKAEIGDCILLVFPVLQSVTQIEVSTGLRQGRGKDRAHQTQNSDVRDHLKHGILEIAFENENSGLLSPSPLPSIESRSMCNCNCSLSHCNGHAFKTVAEFANGMAHWDAPLGLDGVDAHIPSKIACVRIRATKPQNEWVAVQMIRVDMNMTSTDTDADS